MTAGHLARRGRRAPASRPGAIAVLAWALAGCMSSGAQETASPPPFGSSAVAATSAALDPNRPLDWGPLAVVPPQSGMDSTASRGTLRITDTCVFLDGPMGPTLLYWPADQTRWDPGARAIRFDNGGGVVVTAQDGATVSVGGTGSSAAGGGPSAEEWVASWSWVVSPDASCPLHHRWLVGQIDVS